jgi:dinuclear metal center YbgI/SA1388 family protein
VSAVGTTVGGVLSEIERLAPADLAEEWDHVGLQVGAPAQALRRVRVALELTPTLFPLLAAERDTLWVTHHPLLFRPIAAVRTDTPPGSYVAALLSGGHALVACHTNWDKAPGGSDDALALALGLVDPRPLRPSERPQFRISVLVPDDALDPVREAMAQAGAGESERYRRASFAIAGEASFEPRPGARPARGEVGVFSLHGEHRLEMVTGPDTLDQVVRALLAAHPYEEPAYAVERLYRGTPFGGLGRIGELVETTTLGALVFDVAEALSTPGVRVVGDPQRRVRRVASVAGSGRSLIGDAARAGADVLVTADIGHHDARLAADLGLAIVDAGHRETEEPGARALARRLFRRLSDAGVDVAVEFVATEPAFSFQPGTDTRWQGGGSEGAHSR